ncbi:MAG: type IX secretion system membrane protein PorP/SprF [Bacteroidetes bacterium]|nr:type IX secretion system membrane protein PorP/SprF [Bacteroidota bacterium]HET6243246.1 type IX secretion system membrane protein PorP/SprF [Bacteroidia bacterium]
MKKIIISLSLLFSTAIGYSQQDAQFSQNMFNKLAINPGYAGSSNAICATLLGRQQWAGFGDGAPKTFLLSVDAPVKMLRGGVGLNVMQDKIGFFNTSIVNFGYAYRLALGNGILGIGANVGFISHAIKGSWRAIDDYTQDSSIPNESVSDMVLDASFGLYYNIGEQLYVGLSSTRLPASTADAIGGSAPNNYSLNFDFARHYYIMAGYSARLTDELDIKPSVFIKTDASSTQLDLNVNVLYNKMVWAGLSYRMKDAVVVLLGFQHQSGVKIGYAYDFTTSGMARSGENNKRVNTHEIMLGYCFIIPDRPKVSKHRNVRFL